MSGVMQLVENLVSENFCSQLVSGPVKKEITNYSRELLTDIPFVSSLISFGERVSPTSATINLVSRLSIQEVSKKFGKYTINYNPRDDYSVVKFESLNNDAADIEFIVDNKLVENKDNTFSTVDPKGMKILDGVVDLLDSVSIVYK